MSVAILEAPDTMNAHINYNPHQYTAPVRSAMDFPLPLTYTEIIQILPHRYPFLLVDRVTDIKAGEWIEGYKNVSANEPFFNGHFPNLPIMPGVLQVEALAQMGGILLSTLPETAGKLAVFTGIEHVKFRRMVRPGDVLQLRAEITKFRNPIGKAKAIATVNGELAAEGEVTFSLIKA
jgi:3-hydroxyacyl-[acyl-carrier-protein] dehydratase